MVDFVNTIDQLGDKVTIRRIIEKTITEFNDNTLVAVGKNAFARCVLLASVNLPNVATVNNDAFYECSSLTGVNIPNCTSLGNMAFCGCKALTILDLPSVTNINQGAFQGNRNLSPLILRSATLCSLNNKNAFSFGTFAEGQAGGTLLVPRALVESYKTATNWSVIWGYGHNRFLALEDYTVDGTITGEIDWDKLNGGTT